MIITVLLFLILVISYFGYWSGRGMDGYYNSKPMFISHRGITTKYPENTIEAFKHSIKKGFQAIELDVLCSQANCRWSTTPVCKSLNPSEMAGA